MTRPAVSLAEREARLREAIAAMPPMTERERDEQRLSFAYGNLACTTNHKPSRSAFVKFIAEKIGWTLEEAEEWAAARTWEVP